MSCSTQKEAAKMLGISSQTMSNRMKSEMIQKALFEHRKKVLNQTMTKLVNVSTKAVDVLIELLNSQNEGTRYSASSKILQISTDYIQLTDIIGRLDALEKYQKECDTYS